MCRADFYKDTADSPQPDLQLGIAACFQMQMLLYPVIYYMQEKNIKESNPQKTETCPNEVLFC